MKDLQTLNTVPKPPFPTSVISSKSVANLDLSEFFGQKEEGAINILGRYWRKIKLKTSGGNGVRGVGEWAERSKSGLQKNHNLLLQPSNKHLEEILEF